MARIYKRKFWGELPTGASIAEMISEEGKASLVASWKDQKGRPKEAEARWNAKLGTHQIVTGRSKKYTAIYDTPAGDKSKVAYRDKQASQAFAERLERDAARIAEGLLDPVDEQLRKPIGDHLEDFMASRVGRANAEWTEKQVRNRIERVITETRTNRLIDLDPIAIERFFTAHEIEGTTRNEYVGSLDQFMKWASDVGRLEKNPLRTLLKTPRRKITPKHPRRALSPDELVKLLEATVRRPLVEAMTVRTGKNKGRLIANVRGSVKARLELLGRHRRIAYLVAIWSGLRRLELKALEWRDAHFDTDPPRIEPRRQTTKSRRADVIYLHPQIEDELAVMKPHGAKPTDPVLPEVPSMGVLKRDLAFAGIDYGDADIGFADFHSMRMSLNTLMATAGVPLRVRQQHMRHTDPRLTELTYMDERHLPMAEQIGKLPPLLPPSRSTESDE